jgi:hypothetical protein
MCLACTEYGGFFCYRFKKYYDIKVSNLRAKLWASRPKDL